MLKRTYLDSGVLLAAFAGKDDVGIKALQVLDDLDRQFVISEAVKLETLPKPIYQKRLKEIEFYNLIFAEAECLPWSVDTLLKAREVAELHDIAAMDAIHVAAALNAGVDEFVTAEKSTKPMFRVKALSISSIR